MAGLPEQLGVSQDVAHSNPYIDPDLYGIPDDEYHISDPVVSSLPDSSLYYITEIKKTFEEQQEWDVGVTIPIRELFNKKGIYSVSSESIGEGMFSSTYLGMNLQGEQVVIKSTKVTTTEQHYQKETDGTIKVTSEDGIKYMEWKQIEAFQQQELEKSEDAANMCDDPNLVAKETKIWNKRGEVRYSSAAYVDPYTPDESARRLDFIELSDRLSNAPNKPDTAVVGGDLHGNNIGLKNGQVCVLDYDSLRVVDLSTDEIPMDYKLVSYDSGGEIIYDLGSRDVKYNRLNMVEGRLGYIIAIELDHDTRNDTTKEFIRDFSSKMDTYLTDKSPDRRLKVFIIRTMLGDDNFGGDLGTNPRNYLYTDTVYLDKIKDTKMYKEASDGAQKILVDLWEYLNKLTFKKWGGFTQWYIYYIKLSYNICLHIKDIFHEVVRDYRDYQDYQDYQDYPKYHLGPNRYIPYTQIFFQNRH